MTQTKLNEEFPEHHSCSALVCTMAAIQAIVFALCIDRDWNQWKLGYDIRLLTIAYSVYARRNSINQTNKVFICDMNKKIS